MFFGNLKINFPLKLFDSIVSHVERIQEKGKQSTYFSVQRVQKQLSLANLCKITFALFECYKYINKYIQSLF